MAGKHFIVPPNGSPIPIPRFRISSIGRVIDRALISLDGLELVKDFEGCALESYQDSVGVWTIGFGRIRYPDGRRVKQFDQCPIEQAFEWLFLDLQAEGAHYVDAYTKRSDLLSDAQWSALVSFTYNRGAGRFHEKLSGMLDADFFDEHIDVNELRLLGSTMLTYDYAGKDNNRKHLAGLLRRRYAEREMLGGGNWRKFSGPDWLLHVAVTEVKRMIA